MQRKTISGPVSFEGVTLFTAASSQVVIDRAPAGSGLVFVRGDLPTRPSVRASPEHAATTTGRNTAPVRGPAIVGTIEHLMAALAALGVTDALVAVSTEELPIGDGSAGFWMDLLMPGVQALAERVEPIVLTRAVRVSDPKDASATIVAEPADAPSFEYELDYGPDGPIPRGLSLWVGDAADFAANIAPARTFCTATEARAMRAMGMFQHLSPREMLVINDAPGAGGAPIDNTLRFADEPARHKLLDLVGDLWLLGRPVLARVRATRSGHALTQALARDRLGMRRASGLAEGRHTEFIPPGGAVRLCRAQVEGHYDGFSNASLWPVCHGAIIMPACSHPAIINAAVRLFNAP